MTQPGNTPVNPFDQLLPAAEGHVCAQRDVAIRKAPLKFGQSYAYYQFYAHGKASAIIVAQCRAPTCCMVIAPYIPPNKEA